MSTEKAKDYYLNKSGKGKLNCGQAVIAAFIDKFLLDENAIRLFAAYGSGRAPGGECGACYAAKFILKGNHPEKISQCEDAFVSKAGSTKCKEIRRLKKLPCVGCVETAAEFVDNIAGGKCDSGGVHYGACVTKAMNSAISLERQIRIISGGMVVLGVVLAWLVHWAFISISLFVGFGLIYAGLTDNCLMGILLAKLPYNKNKI